jgi:folate-binding protein YgfZ
MNKSEAGVELENWCWFSFSGPDVERYLQGQVSQDVRLLKNRPYIHAALLSNKGRVISDLRIFNSVKNYFVAGHASRASEISERFLRYLIADEVEMTSLTNHKAVFYASCFDLERIGNKVHVFEYELFGRTGKIILTERFCIDSSNLFSVNSLKSERVHSFTPEWGYEISEKTLLQELSDDEKWFSTTKGCYVGQEVVARVHSIGQVNKRLFLFTASHDEVALHEGDSLLADGSEAGFLTSVARDRQNGDFFALGYLKRLFWDQGSFVTARGALVRVVNKSK